MVGRVGPLLSLSSSTAPTLPTLSRVAPFPLSPRDTLRHATPLAPPLSPLATREKKKLIIICGPPVVHPIPSPRNPKEKEIISSISFRFLSSSNITTTNNNNTTTTHPLTHSFRSLKGTEKVFRNSLFNHG